MFKHIDHAANQSLSAVKTQLIKTALILVILCLLATKQHEFLYHAIASHPELNLLIIGVFMFGLVMAVRSIFALYQDERALRWMKETYTDFESVENTSGDHGLTRLLRVAQPPVLFRFPRIVGQVFDIAMEEMMQTRTFRISLAQRNSMMAMVQDSIHREKSLVQYITGVMILLGLIGTFIGLMEMVASVGGIIGGLARAGSGSDEAIKNVIKDLEAPLTGMATGFSASLFGLLGSLVLGLVARFGQSATLVLKHDLEHWLTRISQIEAPTNSAFSGGPGANSSVPALASSLIGSFRTIQGILVRSADVMRKLADRQDTQTEAMGKLMASIDALNVRQEQALWQLRRVDAIGDSVEALRSDAILSEKALGNRLTVEFGRLADIVEQAEERHRNRFADIVEQHRVTERLARSLEIQTARGFEDLSLKSASVLTDQAEVKRLLLEGQDSFAERLRDQNKPVDVTAVSDRVAAAVDERLAAGFGAIAGSLDKSLAGLAESLSRFSDSQSRILHKLEDVTSHPLADEMRNLGKSIETGLATGFADLSRVLDVIIAAQAVAAANSSGGQVIEEGLPSIEREVITQTEEFRAADRQSFSSLRQAFRPVGRN